MEINTTKYEALWDRDFAKHYGKVSKVVGLTIESIGPSAKLGDICHIFLSNSRDKYVSAEVVGFADMKLILMPFEAVEGVGIGCAVENTGHPLSVPVGEALLGHIVDGIGNPTGHRPAVSDRELSG